MNSGNWVAPETALRLGRLTDISPELVPVYRLPGWVEPFVQSWVAGIGLPRMILVRDPVAASERLIVHELVHVHQWRQLGVVRFLLRYVGDYLAGRIAGKQHRQAYLDIRLEQEAREVTERVLSPGS